MKQNKLYTAQLAGEAWDNGKKYERKNGQYEYSEFIKK